jgi:hypothetical protein
MVTRVLIIGGYGNFGSYIARSLKDDADIRLLIGGRSARRRGPSLLRWTLPIRPRAMRSISMATSPKH